MGHKVVRVQDKGSRFVILENEVYEEKIQQQIDRSSFKELKDYPSKLFQQKINNWIEKWYAKKVIDNSWKDFISCDSPSAGKMHGLVKTHKASGCNTAVENLSIFVEKVLYKDVERIPSRIKDTSHMLDIIDNLKDSDLPENSVLVSFDVVNMFPPIDNESGIKAVKKVLNGRESKNPPTECILEALRLWNAIILYLMTKILFKLMVQLKGLTCHAHLVTLLWFILTTELKITLSNPQFGNASEMMFFLSGHTILTLGLLS